MCGEVSRNEEQKRAKTSLERLLQLLVVFAAQCGVEEVGVAVGVAADAGAGVAVGAEADVGVGAGVGVVVGVGVLPVALDGVGVVGVGVVADVVVGVEVGVVVDVVVDVGVGVVVGGDMVGDDVGGDDVIGGLGGVVVDDLADVDVVGVDVVEVGVAVVGSDVASGGGVEGVAGVVLSCGVESGGEEQEHSHHHLNSRGFGQQEKRGNLSWEKGSKHRSVLQHSHYSQKHSLVRLEQVCRALLHLKLIDWEYGEEMEEGNQFEDLHLVLDHRNHHHPEKHPLSKCASVSRVNC